ncbi:hypothetical protein NKG94_14950 [Micromonospora sp. M12]
MIALGLVVGAPWLADALHDPQLTTGLRLVALCLPAATVCEAALAATGLAHPAGLRAHRAGLRADRPAGAHRAGARPRAA